MSKNQYTNVCGFTLCPNGIWHPLGGCNCAKKEAEQAARTRGATERNFPTVELFEAYLRNTNIWNASAREKLLYTAQVNWDNGNSSIVYYRLRGFKALKEVFIPAAGELPPPASMFLGKIMSPMAYQRYVEDLRQASLEAQADAKEQAERARQAAAARKTAESEKAAAEARYAEALRAYLAGEINYRPHREQFNTE